MRALSPWGASLVVVASVASCQHHKGDDAVPRATAPDPAAGVVEASGAAEVGTAIPTPDAAPSPAAAPDAGMEASAPSAGQVAPSGLSADSFRSIRLERTACFGSCPIYSVTLRSDGSIEWSGDTFVDSVGARSGHASPEATRGLFELVAQSGFFSMKGVYRMGPTDHPWANTTVTTTTGSKTVRHYLGSQGAPAVLDRIERRIDEVAGTKRWIGAGGPKGRRGR